MTALAACSALITSVETRKPAASVAFLTCTTVLLATISLAGAAEIEIGPGDDLQANINTLQPGDTLVLRGGTYTVTSRLGIQVNGTAANPCVVRAKDGETPVIHRPNNLQNIIDIESSSHLAFVGIEFSGGSRGVRIRFSSFITIEGCHIHHTEDAALAANDSGSSYQGLRLVGNHIHHTDHTGEGMYLGCNYNGCQVFDSLIEGNYIHDTNAATVTQGDGIEIKEGSYNNVVRDNVIHDTGYPCILTYSTVGNGGPNILEGNLLWSCGDHAIQAAADAVIRNNIILGAAANGISSQPHQSGAPDNLIITHNTVLAASNSALRASGITGSVVIANNALYAQSGSAIRVDGDLGEVVVSSNAGAGSLIGVGSGFDAGGDPAVDLVAASYSGALPQDVFPAVGSLLTGAADPAWLAAEDFNRSPRSGSTDIGAYRHASAGNPGWTLVAGFKETLLLFSDGFESGGTSSWSATVSTAR